METVQQHSAGACTSSSSSGKNTAEPHSNAAHARLIFSYFHARRRALSNAITSHSAQANGYGAETMRRNEAHNLIPQDQIDGSPMEARVAKIESDVAKIQVDVRELRTDMK